MEPAAPAALLQGAIDAARAAAGVVLAHYRDGYEVFDKPDRSPVTTADFAAHRVIDARLRALAPELPVLSEEAAPVPWEVRGRWRRYWLVDPLDGTREFLARNGQFTVNIALIDEHRPRLGVVLAPASGELYFAHAGGGAHRAQDDGAPEPIRTRPCGTTPAVAVGHHSGTQIRALLARLPVRTEHRIGSSLKSCRVAEGALDLYPRFGPTHEWDTAAAQCIVEEAGGCAVDWELRPLRYNHAPSLLNPSFLIAGDAAADWGTLVRGLERRGTE